MTTNAELEAQVSGLAAEHAATKEKVGTLENAHAENAAAIANLTERLDRAVDTVADTATNALVDVLHIIDAKAKEAGHSLVEILVIAAHNQFGIDVRPDEPTSEPEPAA